MKRKLEDLTDKQVIQTTRENDLAFRTLLHDKGYKWYSGASYIGSYKPNENCYNVLDGLQASKDHYLNKGYEILQASDFIKTSKREMLEQNEARLDDLEKKFSELFSKTVEDIQTETRLSALEAKVKALHVPHIQTQSINSKFVPYKIELQPAEPEIKVGMFGAFADRKDSFEKGYFYYGKLTLIRNSDIKYICNGGSSWKHFRPLENPFK